MRHNKTEIIFTLLLILLLAGLINPYWMPGPLLMTSLVLLVVLFGIFATFVWHERACDEREAVHRAHAGRIGFLSGALVLLVAVVYETYMHMLDPWLVYALGAMLIGKIVSVMYYNNNK